MNTSGTTQQGLSRASRLAALAAIALALPFVASEGKAQAPRFGEARTVRGRVQSFTTAPLGEVDGATLDDDTVIHWPPHLADRFTAVIAKGERIKVTGWRETGPAGDTHLEVRTATNLRTDATASNDVAGPPAGPGPIAPNGSDEFAASPRRGGDVERRLKALEDQIAQLREEVRRLSREP
jgi:hypothetical protein